MIPPLKKILPAFALAAGLFVASTGKTQAATYTYSDVDAINLSMVSGTGTAVYNGSFDFFPPDLDANTFTATGFGPASGTYVSNFGYQIGQPIIEGTISFFFKDPNGGSEEATVTALSINIGDISSFANYSIFSQGLEINFLTTIVNNGVLHYTVTVNSGELDLVAGIGTITVNVPDGGTTLAMLGGSLAGMVALRKRLFRGKKA